MDQLLIEALSQRDAKIIERQKYLEEFIKEHKDLEDERQHIAALLEKYRTPSTNVPLPPPPSYQENILSDHPVNTQRYNKMKTRHSPGLAEGHIIQILSKGETHSTASLVKRLKEIFNIDYSDSTVGVALKRGEKQGKFKRDGYQWSIVLNQNQPSQQSGETLIDNAEKGNADDEYTL